MENLLNTCRIRFTDFELLLVLAAINNAKIDGRFDDVDTKNKIRALEKVVSRMVRAFNRMRKEQLCRSK